MDPENRWVLLVSIFCLRVASVLVPQSGYIHPDEFFQTSEVVAGDVLKVQTHRTWEFTWSEPIRSIVMPYITCAPVLLLLRWLHLATPYLVLVLPRLIITAAALVVDRCVYILCRRFNSDGYTSLFLYGLSYVAWTYMTRTFSNTLEAILFALLLVLTLPTRDVPRARSFSRRRQQAEPCGWDSAAITAIFVVGIFNRPTFLIFSLVPISIWKWKVFFTDLDWTDKWYVFNIWLKHSAIALGTAISTACMFVFVDTLYFRYDTVQNFPTDFQNCVFHDKSKFECLGNLYSFYKPLITVTPLNFFMYNSKAENLSEHGSHPWYLHGLISIPLLFGPVAVFLLWRVSKNILNVLLGGSLKVSSDFHLDDVNLVASFALPLVVFSFVPHQEPRFLLPLVPLGVVIATKTIRHLSLQWKAPLAGVFCVFNMAALFVFGYLHQGGVAPAVGMLHNKIASSAGPNHVVFYHTYMPPQHLFVHPQESNSKLVIHDLAGSSSSKLQETMNGIRDSAASSRGGDSFGIWIVAPSTVLSDVKKLDVNFGNETTFPHVSMEDPPRIMDWLRGHITCSDLCSDCHVNVLEVKSWKIFRGEQAKSKGKSK